ncbi:hypothetical protein E05_20520 [Plautia stali symbiont]|nr:hypothetical protein E05_20520 [Plautia stali symbiont]
MHKRHQPHVGAESPAIATIADAPPGDDPHAPVGPGSELKRTSRKPNSPLAASVSSSTASTTGQSSRSGERIAGDRLWPIMQPSTACASTNSRLSMRTVAPLRPIMVPTIIGPSSKCGRQV